MEFVRRIFSSGLSLLALTQTLSAQSPATWQADSDTIFAIAVREGDDGSLGITNIATGEVVSSYGVQIMSDADHGHVIEFGETPENDEPHGVFAPYIGDEEVLRGQGFTLEYFVRPTPQTEIPYNVMFHNGFGFFSVGKSGLTTPRDQPTARVDYLNFPNLPVHVEPEAQGARVRAYPDAWRASGTTEGMTTNAWNHVIYTYHEDLKVVRTWINGVLGRDLDVVREGQAWVKFPQRTSRLFQTLDFAKVAGIRLRKGVFDPAEPPQVKVYLNQLPWQEKMVVTLDKLDPSLPLPISIQFDLGGGNVLTETLNSHDLFHLELPVTGQTNAIQTFEVELSAGGGVVHQEVVEYLDQVLPADPLIQINEDHSITARGERFFPLMLYGVHIDEFRYAGDLGFNIVLARDPVGGNTNINSFWQSRMESYLQAADEIGAYGRISPNLLPGRDFTGKMDVYRPYRSSLLMQTVDEPFHDWERHRDNYNRTREIAPQFPHYTVVNNSTHLKNASTFCDILATDPYAAPNLSTRHVTKMTRDSIEASFGLKPIWTVIGCYRDKPANIIELRNMAYLALCAGARGIGIYSWDSRSVIDGVRQDNFYYLPDYPHLLRSTHRVATELKRLSSIFIEQNAPGAVTVPEDQVSIAASIKVVEGQRYLLMANDERIEKPATMTLATTESLTALPHELSALREPLQFVDGVCQVTLPALATGIFALDGTPASQPFSLSIEAEDHAIGNEVSFSADDSLSGRGSLSTQPGASARYPIEFMQPGSYRVFVRARSATGGSLTFSGPQNQVSAAISNSPTWEWVLAGESLTIEERGLSFVVLSSDDRLEIDRFVLTSDPSYTPDETLHRLSSSYLFHPDQATTYETWAELIGLSGGPDDDSDGDGRSHFEDFIINRPTGTSWVTPAVRIDEILTLGSRTQATISFRVRKAALRLNATIEASPNLQADSWQNLGKPRTIQTSREDDSDILTTTITYPTANEFRFFRLNISRRPY